MSMNDRYGVCYVICGAQDKLVLIQNIQKVLEDQGGDVCVVFGKLLWGDGFMDLLEF